MPPQDRGRRSRALGDLTLGWIDDRTGVAHLARNKIRKVFPDHWSFMLGEIALWNFVVLLITGVLLTLWFDPSMAEVEYNGSYDQLRGVTVSRAYASALELSFDVRGGLLLRQIHHWAAMLFIAGMLVHFIRVFSTGAFRKPREVTFIVGITMLVVGMLEGFVGYSLPDDLLSGTGLRIADGLIRSIPVVGAYASLLVFGGEFPGDNIVPRFYIAHVLLLPGLLLILVTLHLMLLVYHKHTHWPGPGRCDENVVGYPFLPTYMAKTGGFFFVVFGTTAVMGGLLSINPIWKYGPYDPAKVTAGSQPDWYMGFLEGLLRVMPGWETEVFGYTVSWNVFVPGVIVPSLMLLALLSYPFVEARITGDTAEHHVLQRPRAAPTRTAFLVAMIVLYGLLWAAGGNDVLALVFSLDVNQITYAVRALVIVGPPIAFVITRWWCLSLQHEDSEVEAHGFATGVILRSRAGGYSERHLTGPDVAATPDATNKDEYEPDVPDVSEAAFDGPHGARGRRGSSARVRRPSLRRKQGSVASGRTD